MGVGAEAKSLARMGLAALSGRVEYVILFVTAHCNLRCSHCFYIEQIRNASKKHELSLDEYGRIAGNLGRVLQVSITGGEPFLRRDLAGIVQAFHQRSGALAFNLTSNGLLRDRIVTTLQEIFTDAPALSLRLGLSLDGFEDVHDRTRGKDGGFEQVLATLEALRELRDRHPGFTVHVSTTLTRDNAATINDFIDFIATLDVDAHYLGYIRGDVVLDPGLKDVTLADYRAATAHLKHRWVSRAGYQNLLNLVTVLKDTVTSRILEEDAYFFPCVAGKKMITIDEEGLVKPCEMLEQMGITPYVMGDLRQHDYDVYKVLASHAGRRIRGRIVDERCYCTFECANVANVALSPVNFVKAAALHATQALRRTALR